MKKASREPETKHYQQTRNNKLKTDRICYKWNNFKCWKGKNCIYDHPVRCDAYVNNNPCIKDPCKLYHPQVCWANQSRKVCRWGERCKFRHVHDNVQRNSHWKYENRTHHRIQQTPYPQSGIPTTTKADMAFQTNVIKKVVMMVITMDTEIAIEMARIFGWID